ncbi:P-loop NTPase fold protein [Carnobacterium maltaromaticum]|uniref:KAP family P-loop NTPase fold protein n=1 Tax=Carnobacterium maltaromaticum TaxID=2751 RepID=UPI00191BA808|nr:P-loop NTPase fold protein [Carnobacterium maltaromaticum]CAD5902105.1 conserved hypothetical protein [Carnobacterium maltaromaticum]
MEIKNRIDINDEQKLIQLLQIDYLQRKKHLNNLITLFKNVSDPIVVGIDGEWGTGKTIFLKQFEILVNNKEEIESASFPILKEFKTNNTVFYFNSWENDMYDNPLQSLLFNLAKKYENDLNRKNYDIRNLLKYGKTIFNIGLKVVSKGVLESDDLKVGHEDNTQLLDSILTVEEIRKEIDKFLNIITKEKKLIIIVDELDRCKPTFAIELLEVIKHYFLHNSVHFILCSNKSELTHTVKRYYGQDFNGYEYLDRFFDFEYNLPTPNRIDYAKNVLGTDKDNYFYISHMVIDYFKLSLRQINKYILNTEIILNSGILNSWNNKYERLLFLFYISGLIIKDREAAKKFIDGKGFENFTPFYSENSAQINRLVSSNGESTIPKLEKIYNSIFNYKQENTPSYELTNFLEFLSSIS